jgi:YHS domain-containing protein
MDERQQTGRASKSLAVDFDREVNPAMPDAAIMPSPILEGSTQPKGTLAKSAPVTDPVCRMEIEPHDATATREYRGHTYYFCTEACGLQFDRDPEQYLNPAPEAD